MACLSRRRIGLPGESATVSVVSGRASLGCLRCARTPGASSPDRELTRESRVSGTGVADPDSLGGPLCVGDPTSPGEVGITESGRASALRCSYAAVPGTFPWLGLLGSTFSTIVCGIGDPPGVKGRSWNSAPKWLLLRAPSGTTSISSGTASCSRCSYACVPGTSPCEGSASTLSTRVRGTGDAEVWESAR